MYGPPDEGGSHLRHNAAVHEHRRDVEAASSRGGGVMTHATGGTVFLERMDDKWLHVVRLRCVNPNPEMWGLSYFAFARQADGKVDVLPGEDWFSWQLGELSEEVRDDYIGEARDPEGEEARCLALSLDLLRKLLPVAGDLRPATGEWDLDCVTRAGMFLHALIAEHELLRRLTFSEREFGRSHLNERAALSLMYSVRAPLGIVDVTWDE